MAKKRHETITAESIQRAWEKTESPRTVTRVAGTLKVAPATLYTRLSVLRGRNTEGLPMFELMRGPRSVRPILITDPTKIPTRIVWEKVVVEKAKAILLALPTDIEGVSFDRSGNITLRRIEQQQLHMNGDTRH